MKLVFSYVEEFNREKNILSGNGFRTLSFVTHKPHLKVWIWKPAETGTSNTSQAYGSL